MCVLQQCNYGAQMLLAPEWANDFYYKKGAVEAAPKWQAWMGQALVGQGITSLLSRKVATKQQMQGVSLAWATALPIMAMQKDDFKPEQLAVNAAFCGGMALLCHKVSEGM